MKQIASAYTYNKTNGVITLTGVDIDRNQLLLIVNTTRNVTYYNFADSATTLQAFTKGSNTSITLASSVVSASSAHTNADALTIYYDDQSATQAIAGTVTANLSKLASHASTITKADNQIQIIGGYSGGSPTNAAAYPLGVESNGYINSNLRWGATGVLVDTGASALPVQVNTTLPNFDALTLSGVSLATDATISFTSGQILWAGTNANQSIALDPAGVKGRAFLVKFYNNGSAGASMQGQFFGAGTLTGSLLDNNPSYKVQPSPRGFNNSPIAVAADNVSTYYLFMAGLKPFASSLGATLEALPFDLNFGVYTTSGTGSGRIEIYKINIPSELALNSVIHGNLREWLLSPTVTANTGLTQPLTDAQLRATAVPVTTYPRQGSTVSNTNFSSLTSAELAPAVANRESLTVYNEGSGTLFINVGGSASTTSYQVRLQSGEYWEAPAGQLSLQHSAIFGSAGTARVTQIS